MEEVTAYIALGANIGERAINIQKAVDAINHTNGVTVGSVSRSFENSAVGGPEGSPDFLNAVVEVETSLEPGALLLRLLDIERSLGRERREKWGPRIIDLDLILYGDQIIDTPELKIPHPLMHQRRFVLEPLVEIAPGVRHPILNKTARQLLAELPQDP
jgi:2-amino-4-hydroxy-6-hydroxymethyldihydropteridine diphosphokinase